MDAPIVIVTVAIAARQPDPEVAERKNRLYADAVTRHGAVPLLLDARASSAERAEAFGAMHGLLLSGGADIDPGRYGARVAGAVDMEPDRDELEASAWQAAEERGLPVLGLCRGLQAINVFSGGTLTQHVDGHAGLPFGRAGATTHPLRVQAGTRLARILNPTNTRGGVHEVNTYHHQAVTRGDLARSLVPSAWAASPAGDLIEGLETRTGRFVLGVQCHPERTDSTPPAFERLFAFFVDACRGPVSAR
jgi:putative glutamine amidotransferase